jgi:hypothetical protein
MPSRQLTDASDQESTCPTKDIRPTWQVSALRTGATPEHHQGRLARWALAPRGICCAGPRGEAEGGVVNRGARERAVIIPIVFMI